MMWNRMFDVISGYDRLICFFFFGKVPFDLFMSCKNKRMLFSYSVKLDARG